MFRYQLSLAAAPVFNIRPRDAAKQYDGSNKQVVRLTEIPLLKYSEFNKKYRSSVVDMPCCEYLPQEKQLILDYLNNISFFLKEVEMGLGVIDAFTGEQADVEDAYYADGRYVWHSSLAYYITHYNTCIPTNFISHIKRSAESLK